MLTTDYNLVGSAPCGRRATQRDPGSTTRDSDGLTETVTVEYPCGCTVVSQFDGRDWTEVEHPCHMRGAELIVAERDRQVREEGWVPEHDDQHVFQELQHAAASYLCVGEGAATPPPVMWCFDASWWKPSDDEVRNLVKSGALIAAEIDRVLRARKEAERGAARGVPGRLDPSVGQPGSPSDGGGP